MFVGLSVLVKKGIEVYNIILLHVLRGYLYILYNFQNVSKFSGKISYREKAIFAFEEIDGKEFCFFGLRTQVSKMVFFC